MTKSGKHCGERRNCLFWAISFFVTVFKKLSAAEALESVYMRERVKYEKIWLNPVIEFKTMWHKDKLRNYEHFLIMTECFQKASAAVASESVYMREREKLWAFTFSHIDRTFSKGICCRGVGKPLYLGKGKQI